MKTRLSRGLLLCLTCLWTLPARSADSVDFVDDVYPILETYCIGCHNADDPQGGLVMDEFGELMQGGDSGVVITAGVPDSSRLLLMASGQLEPVMPPDGAEGPEEQELKVLAAWIEQGAHGPEGEMPIKRRLRTPDIEPAPSVNKPLTAIAVSPDATRTARAQFGRIRIAANDQTGTAVEIRSDDLGKINALDFSADGTRLLVASGLTGAYGRAAIYDSQSGELLQEFVGHRDILYAAEFSPRGDLIATAGYDRKIRLWDVESGDVIRELLGHNGAIFDLAFSPDGKVLVSACADETAKVWNVASGQRLDTLSQPEGEVFAVAVTRDGNFVLAGSGDNRIRVWRLKSVEAAQINPLVATRFVDETPIVNFALSPDGEALVAIAESGNVKVLRTSDWQPVASLEPLGESATDLFVTAGSRKINFSLMDGRLISRELPEIAGRGNAPEHAGPQPVFMDLGQPTALQESDLRSRQQAHRGGSAQDTAQELPVLDVDRHVTITGAIDAASQTDQYRWRAGQGEVWAIDADAVSGSRLDPIVTVLDAAGQPVPRVRLQAVRDSYFTFRGKNSEQINDFRLFNWQEMDLNEYLYAAGEVTRLMVHPRGPDSGFNVYPGEGKRWTYFGTSGTAHALGEPAYIVQPLPPGAEALANGLPVFDVIYQNDDDPRRLHGKNSRLLFTAPRDGLYTIRLGDTRGEGGNDYAYQLAVRAAAPSFRPLVGQVRKPLHPGTGREVKVSVDRIDGYEGPVTFELRGLPERLVSNFPVTIEPGQRSAVGVIWADPSESGWDGEIQPRLVARATINGRLVERDAGTAGKLTFDPKPAPVVPIIQPAGQPLAAHEHWTLRVRRGETVSAKVLVERNGGFSNRVSFGKEYSGRNASQGVYVDNIGLNGLLILADSSQREFFVTADETAKPGRRSFFLTTSVDGGLASHPITVEVLP